MKSELLSKFSLLLITISSISLVLVSLIVSVNAWFTNTSTENRSRANNEAVVEEKNITPITSATSKKSISEVDFRQFYLQNSGFNIIKPTFGAYALEPLEDSLFVGLSGGVPVKGGDGALLVKFQNGFLQSLSVSNNNGDSRITEQGIHVIKILGNKKSLIVPGTDPCCGDNWDYGNVYINLINSRFLRKYRYNSGLTNVVHFWNIAETPNGLYGAASSYFAGLGEWGTAGEIFLSRNGGRSWQRVTPDPQQFLNHPNELLSTYRITDIAWFNNRLYIINGREGSSNQPAVQYSSDMGLTWQKFNNLEGEESPRMIIHQDTLVGVTKGRGSLFLIDQNNQTQTVSIKYQNSVKTVTNSFQVLASSGTYLFVITSDNMILKTSNPSSEEWDLATTLENAPIAINYWPNKGSLVVATMGETGKILEIDPKASITPPPTPTNGANQCLECKNPLYDHNQNTMVDQDDASWFIANCLGQPASTVCPNFDQQSANFTSSDIACISACIGNRVDQSQSQKVPQL